MTSFWSAYIIVLTVITIVGTFWVLLANRSRPAGTEAKTGHEYDGIEEYDNPLPAWWLYMFLITLVFGIGYLLAFPGLGSYQGLLKWNQIEQWQRELQRAEARYEPVFAAYRDMSPEAIAADPQAVRMGQRIFANNCAQCHGSDARGSKGFPNLTDADWIYGGSPDTIHTTIVNGRQAAMPPWGTVLGDEGVTNVAHYVLTLSGAQAPNAQSAAGEAQFKAVCAACHGADGKGNQLLGAPNLTDTVWLYGGDLETIKHGIRSGRNGRMPAFGEQLNEDKIRLLTAYVHSLSTQ